MTNCLLHYEQKHDFWSMTELSRSFLYGLFETRDQSYNRNENKKNRESDGLDAIILNIKHITK